MALKVARPRVQIKTLLSASLQRDINVSTGKPVEARARGWLPRRPDLFRANKSLSKQTGLLVYCEQVGDDLCANGPNAVAMVRGFRQCAVAVCRHRWELPLVGSRSFASLLPFQNHV